MLKEIPPSQALGQGEGFTFAEGKNQTYGLFFMKWILVVLAVVSVVFLQLKRGEVGVKRGDDGLYYKADSTTLFTGEGLVYHPNGKKAAHGQIVDGKPTGTWSHWYFNGQLEAKGNYSEGKRDGVWVQFDETGGKLEEATWVDDVKQAPADPTATQTLDNTDSAEAPKTKKEPKKE